MVSLIVVDYKTIPKTLEYIVACYSWIDDSKLIHAIIVDNCEDTEVGLGILEEICQNKPMEVKIEDMEAPVFACIHEGKKLLYVCAGQNLGYARGNNLGAFVAKKYYEDGQYLFSNNDLRFTERFSLETLIAPMQENTNVALVGPQIVTPAREQQSPRKRIGTFKQLFAYYDDLLLPKCIKFTDKITDVDVSNDSKLCYWVTGSFMLANAAKFWEVEGFDEATFLFCEEVILAERFLQKGYRVYYENQVKVIHEHGQTVKASLQVLKSIRISFQSSVYYYTKYRGLHKSIAALAYAHFGIFQLLFSLKKQLGRIIGKQ